MHVGMKWLSLVPLFYATLPGAQPLQRTYERWQITCNNLNSCEARSVPGDGGLVMTVVRHAGQADGPMLRLEEGRYPDKPAGEDLQSGLLLDGQPLSLDRQRWQTSPDHLTTVDPAAVHDFLAHIVNAEALQLMHRADASLSLRGLKSALRLMDEVQGRVDDETAWVRRGVRPAIDVPAAPEPPRVRVPDRPPLPLTPAESRALIDFGSHVDRDSCSLDVQRREVSVSPLTDDKALLLIDCERGAYNIIELAYEVTRQPPYVSRDITLMLPFVPAGQSDTQLDIINAEYDAVSSELVTFSQSRGTGNCGVATRWQYTGREFQLVEYAQQSACDAGNGRTRWPTLWVSRVESLPGGSVEILP